MMQFKWIIISLVIVLFTAACTNRDTNKHAKEMHDTTPGKNEATLYTCPMHPQIRSHKPGKCPICGMTLIPVKPAMQKGSDTVQLVTLSAQQQFLGNIRTDTAKLTSLSGELTLAGITIFDPQDQHIISARVSGWIEKMYVRNPGERVKAGQKLYEIYSPELLATEKDYLLALKQKNLFNKASVDLSATIQAMKQKLLRWGLSTAEIERLPDHELTGRAPVYSKTSGYLIEKMKEEGDRINEGDAVVKLANNNTLWVQAQLYDSELSLLHGRNEIKVSFPAFPGKMVSGKIAFNNPVNNYNSGVHLLNIIIPNFNGQIQPGMQAYVYLQTGEEQLSVAIPKTAVIYGEKGNYVWLQQPDSTSKSLAARYVRREVRLGMDNNGEVQVLGGISPGELVVSSGAYLVNSEYILQHGSGANLAGMTMSDMKMTGKSK